MSAGYSSLCSSRTLKAGAIGSLLCAAMQPAPFASLMVLQAVCAGIGGFGFSQAVIGHLRPHCAEFIGRKG